MKLKNLHYQEAEEGDIVISRPSPLGNPYTHLKNKKTFAKYIVKTREEAIAKYRIWLYKQLKSGNEEILSELEKIKPDSTLTCFCFPAACHGQVIISLLEKFTIEEIRNWSKK